MIEQKTRSANKDKTVEILLHDSMNYHFKCVRISVTPGKEQFPSRMTIIRQFKKEVLDKLPETWPQLANFQETILVHDPTLMSEQELKEAEAALSDLLKPKVHEPGSIEQLAADLKKMKRQMKNKV